MGITDEHRKNAMSVCPVSYTHLDVYKRQELNDSMPIIKMNPKEKVENQSIKQI